ncbi:MAG: GNAT family N-acetyltransferase [Thermotogota bacterium]
MFKFKEIEDIVEFSEIASFSFSVPNEDKDTLLKELSELQKNKEKLFGIFEDKKLISGLVLIDYNMRIRENIVKMGGIAFVCSRNDSRGKKSIKLLMEKTVDYMKKNNYVVSALYPFSLEFYRKYGWEMFQNSKIYKISTGEIVKSKLNEDYEYEEVRVITEDIKQFYNKYAAKNHNFCQKSQNAWDHFINFKWNSQISRGVIKFTHKDEIKGLILYSYSKNDKKKSIYTIYNFIYEDANTKKLMFNYLASLSKQISEVYIFLPNDFVLWPHVNERYKTEDDLVSPMIRVIDIEKLNGLKTKGQDMNVNIEIEDKQAVWNNGIFNVKIIEGEIQITGSEEADITMNIGTFSSILSGFTNIEEMLDSGKATIIDNYNGTDLKKYPTFLNEFF